jgi:hypothetical protein
MRHWPWPEHAFGHEPARESGRGGGELACARDLWPRACRGRTHCARSRGPRSRRSSRKCPSCGRRCPCPRTPCSGARPPRCRAPTPARAHGTGTCGGGRRGRRPGIAPLRGRPARGTCAPGPRMASSDETSTCSRVCATPARSTALPKAGCARRADGRGAPRPAAPRLQRHAPPPGGTRAARSRSPPSRSSSGTWSPPSTRRGPSTPSGTKRPPRRPTPRAPTPSRSYASGKQHTKRTQGRCADARARRARARRRRTFRNRSRKRAKCRTCGGLRAPRALPSRPTLREKGARRGRRARAS